MLSKVVTWADNNIAATWPGAADYLVFQLGLEEFGILALTVREIMGVPAITTVRQMPLYVRGVINLRGRIVPIVDLRLKFGLPEIGYTQDTCIIVVQLKGSAIIGIVVDSVSQLPNLAASEVELLLDDFEDMFTSYELQELAISWDEA